jgi:hypothetical protein
LGTGVVSKLGDQGGYVTYLELGTVIVATAQLVFDFGGRARTHDFLQRRYYEVISEIEGQEAETVEDRLKYGAKLLLICAEEPMTMRAVDAVAYNKAIDGTVYDSKDRKQQRLHVNFWRRSLRHFLAFHNVDFVPEGE